MRVTNWFVEAPSEGFQLIIEQSERWIVNLIQCVEIDWHGDNFKLLQSQLNPSRSSVENTLRKRYFEKFDDSWKQFGCQFD